MASYPSINLVDSIIDEVALEGLDGITIEALWLRLAHRLHAPLPFSKAFTAQIWSICVQIKEFAFYELKTPREPLVIFDRYQFVDPDLGIILEPENAPPDIYPHCPIHDVANNVIGSCSSYYTRKDVTEALRKLSLDEVSEKYGQRLVIVASQAARKHALMGNEVSPTLVLNVIQYCFLERVGRSRYHGEVTQGKLSLNALKEDPKSLFYHRKFMLSHKLITKQLHHQKIGSHCCNGSLLHLPRFFVERKPKIIFLAEEVIRILKSKPNCVAEYDEIKRKLQIENAIRKLFKTSFFQKVVKTDLRVPYRTLYPNATPTEWQQKNNPTKEKKIKVVQLLSPNIDILEAWNKDEVQEEEEPQELSISSHKYSVPYLKQANAIIEATGSDGLCQGGLSRIMGLTKLQSRTILRNIVKTNIVATYMNDIGRQRLTKYVSKRYEKGSKLSKQFKKEMHKIKELTKQITTVNDDSERSKMIVEQEESTIVNEPKEIVEEMVPSAASSDDNKIQSIPKPEEELSVVAHDLQSVFYVVNRILYKYRVIRRPNRYKRTFSGKIQAREQNAASKKPSSKISDLSEDEKAAAAYKNIKVDLTVFKSTGTKKSESEIYGFMEDVQNSERKTGTNITYRLLRRANMIIETVKEHQVIDDMAKLMKMIHEEEDKEGYDVKIDKKSLIRLLQKLAKDNLVKNIKVTLSGNGKEKRLTFICDPSVEVNGRLVQSAVEQAKLKFYLLSFQTFKSSTRKYAEPVDSASVSEKKSFFKQPATAPTGFKCGPRVSRKYGYSPKFLRMQALHIFLFYLVYEHPGEQTLSRAEQLKALRDNGFSVAEDLAEELGTVYTNTVSWKTFVPPLRKYTGWPVGWTLMSDVLLRLPLSIFLKIHYVSFATPELDRYANHPIRKHYLVKDLPVEIRNSLLYARKYIFNIHETVTRLCYIGLVQFGPQRLKEKDQVFIYVNRRAELMDTTSSAPNYHIIEEKPYPVIKYSFDEVQVVEKYWYDMWNTCINTPLGGRLVVQGKDIVLEDLNKKSDMLEAITARSPEEAIKLDTGKVPGDHKGAAGIDSACFAHLKRNWNWGYSNVVARQTKKKQNVVYERDAYLSKIKAKPIRFTDFSGLKTVSGPPSAMELRKKAQTEEKTPDQPNKYEVLPYQRNTKQKSYIRRVLPRKSINKKRTKYDEVDYRALQRMHKLRVDWEPHEDKILLVCKVAMVYLCPNPRKQVITFSAVRDVLWMYSYTSYNKTSRACQRRLLYMLRQQRNVNAVTLGVEELKQNFFLRKRFDGIVEKLKEEYKSSHEYEKQVAEVFKSLVSYVAKKYYDISDVGSKEPLPVPLTVQEFNLFYKIVHPTKPFYNRGFTKDVRTVSDVQSAVINSAIHSSMCCGKDRRSWSYQLFKVYQQYPETLLRTAMAKIRNDQMVTIKKNQLTTIRKYGNYMPMSSSQYQLSSNYVYKFHTRWPYDIFRESYDVFLRLSKWYSHNQTDESESLGIFNGIEVLPVTGGVVGAIHDYIIRDQIDFDIEIPDQVIMLDPRLKEKDETYFRIAKRYQDVLASLDNLKLLKETGLQSSSAKVDSEQEDDELNFDSDEESGRNAIDDEQNVIRFQDGTRIALNEDEVKETEKPVSDKLQSSNTRDSPASKRPREQSDSAEPAQKRRKVEDEASSSELKKERAFTRVSDILKETPPEQSYLNSYCKLDDSADIHKRYTRIALLRMREELSELTIADSHHAHEYFVVNMFKVFYHLYRSNPESSEGNEIFRGFSLPSDLLPLKLNAANDLIQELNKFAVFPKDGVSYSEFKKALPDGQLDSNRVEAVCKFVRERKELGASIQELIDEFEGVLGEDLQRIVSLLTEHRLLLRSGVTIVRYIHHRYVDCWLIHSYKICRVERESLVPMPKGTICAIDQKEEKDESSKARGESVAEEDAASSHSDEEYAQPKRRTQRKRTRSLPQRDLSRAAKQLDLNTRQEIRVAIKPWIRIDGVLNRRVLDRMLGSVLSYCLTHPGIALTKIQNRFVPALQPCHTRELVEILEKLGCLQRLILKKSRVTLFSKSTPVKPKIANNSWAAEEDIFLEPTSGAMLKFGIFLSTKMYNTDFIV